MDEASVIYDWNHVAAAPYPRVDVHDETLRDGIQSPSVHDPDPDAKAGVVRSLARLGVTSVNVGLPGAGPRAVEDSERLVRMVRDERLGIGVGCAARTHAADIRPIVEIAQRTGVPVEVMTFLGSSPIRMYAEGWDESRLEALTRDAVRLGVQGGCPVSFVTEDTIRSRPDTLDRLFQAAVEEGADRLVLCDTVGHATPEGAAALVRWTDELLRRLGVRDRVRIDWHGHQDRGLSLINALAAGAAGADRLHGTVLGVGERVGNTALDQLLVNLRLLGVWEADLAPLADLVDRVSAATHVPIPVTYPVFGSDAFRTGTGVHAAAVIKAEKRGQGWLADRIYSGVPAAWFGRSQVIEIGHQSGLSNVRYWMARRGLPDDDRVAQAIFDRAKATNRLLTDDEILGVVRESASG
jgi:2-isopropylmalate synthase